MKTLAARLLERSFPDAFGRREIQLGVQINSQQTVNNKLVVSAEVAEKLEQRSRKMEAEVDRLLAERQAKFQARHPAEEQSADSAPVIEAEVVPGPITLPRKEERTASWWRQLSRGFSSRGDHPRSVPVRARDGDGQTAWDPGGRPAGG